MDQAVKDLAVKCDANMLDDVKKNMVKGYENAQKTNGYWSSIVWNDFFLKRDDHTNYKALVEAQTPEKISAFVKEFLAGANKVSVVMLPQE